MKKQAWILYGLVVVCVLGLGWTLYQELGEQMQRKEDKKAFQNRLREMQSTRSNPIQSAQYTWSDLPQQTRSDLKQIGFFPADLSDTSRPGFTLPDLEGESHSLSRHRGEWVLLNFWATWCAPCRLEMPSMQTLWEQHRSDRLVILAVNLQEDPSRVRQFQREYKLTFPILLDRKGTVADRFYVTGVPETWLISPRGRPIAKLNGGREWDTARVQNVVQTLLGLRTARLFPTHTNPRMIAQTD